MGDNKVIIIDETQDEDQVLSQEELDEIQRNERLNKIFNTRKKKRTNDSLWSLISKITNIVALSGIMIGMLLESGAVFAVCLAIILISSTVNYIFYK